MSIRVGSKEKLRVFAGAQTLKCNAANGFATSLKALWGDNECSYQLGSWAKLMVDAMFARNKTRNAMKITTTPPTVIRSQKSELSRIIIASLADGTAAHFLNSTVGADVCSDHHHNRNLVWNFSSSSYQITFQFFL